MDCSSGLRRRRPSAVASRSRVHQNPRAPHFDDGGEASGRCLARLSTESLASRHCTSSSMIDECRVFLIAGALATACSSASSAGPTGDGSNRGGATGPEADGGQLTDSSASSIDARSADDGPGKGGVDGGAAVTAQNANNYDGARPTTVLFDAAWKFHLGDATGAQATTFDDSSWTSLDVPHDWSARSHSTKAPQQVPAVGTSTAASGGIERRSRCRRPAKGNGSSSSSMARTWTAPFG